MAEQSLFGRVVEGLPSDVEEIYVSVGLINGSGKYYPGVACRGLTKSGDDFSYQVESNLGSKSNEAREQAMGAAEEFCRYLGERDIKVKKGFFGPFTDVPEEFL